MIKKVGSLYFVFNKTGEKKLSKGYTSKKGANIRMGQIEFFKHKKE